MFGIENFNLPIVDFSNFQISQLLDALIFGGAVLFIGMAAIFGVLCILWLFMVIFKLVFHDLPKKRKPKKVAPDPIIFNEPVEVNKDENEELIAVISAAVAMAEEDDSGKKFRVVSFKRT